MSSEFNIIAKHFTRPTPQADLGVGDDAALLKVADGHQLVVSTDMSVAGTHFFADAAPFDVGWKSLAVNVSDIAAMGANPKWATLSIALPAIDETWLTEFSRGFFACADAFHLDLIGGDTTRGPLNISVTMMGEVPTGKALQRNGAKVGDDIWVSGTLGSAALALAILQNQYKLNINDQIDAFEKWNASLNRPQPRVSLGMALRDIATSCIDISDGLLADLGHILSASNLGAEVHLEKLPMSLYHLNHLSESEIQKSVLAGGDDYELCFTAPASKRNEIELIGKQQHILLTCIAATTMDIGLRAKFKNNDLNLSNKGFDHFD
jgi:thiamine-monophosphate kinase